MRVLYGVCACLAFGNFLPNPASSGDLPQIKFREGQGEVSVTIGDSPIARYVWSDPNIPRPYFCDVKSPSGIQVTRNHPPLEGVDRTDHPTFHPGIWLGFGDIGGEDFWRLKARVKQESLAIAPHETMGVGAFQVENVFIGKEGHEVCREECTFQFRILPGEAQPLGYLLMQDSSFSSDRGNFVFGDQEEMGFAVRVATPLNGKDGGRVVNAEGLEGEAEVWGKTSEWCDYSGIIDGVHVGMTLIPHPENFRESWMHARDYGVLLANPFGRKAYTDGEASAVEIQKGEKFRYRNGVFIYSSKEKDPSLPKRGYEAYLKASQGH